MSNNQQNQPPPGYQGGTGQSNNNNNNSYYNSNNPFQQGTSNTAYQQYQQQPFSGQQTTEAPPGPPPRRTGTFEETNFVPQNERGEQREAMEQFEMNKTGPQDSTDRDVETLQGEFPTVDGSLIAAIYGDSKNMGATREMLQELASGAQGS